MILCYVKNELEGVLRVPRREDGSERSRSLHAGGASGYLSHNCSRTKKNATLKFFYFIGRNFSFITRWFLRKNGSKFEKESNLFLIFENGGQILIFLKNGCNNLKDAPVEHLVINQTISRNEKKTPCWNFAVL